VANCVQAFVPYTHHFGLGSTAGVSDKSANLVWRNNLHTVCHLGGTNHLVPLALVRVSEAGEASIQSVCNERGLARCHVKCGDVGGPWIRTWAGGVSRFLLPTFLCGGKEK